MVSSFSNPGFPPVHTRHTADPRLSSLEDRVASLEASLEAIIASLPSLIADAIDAAFDTTFDKALAKAFDASFENFRGEMLSRGAGEGISAPLAGDHHGSPAIDLIQLPRSPICAEGAQSQLIPSAVQAPSLLSSLPSLRALATSAVKLHSKDSAAATVSLPASKTVIHASTMTIAPWLILPHSFPDTTKTGSEDGRGPRGKESKDEMANKKMEEEKGYDNNRNISETKPSTSRISISNAGRESIVHEEFHEASSIYGYKAEVLSNADRAMKNSVAITSQEQSYDISPYKELDDENDDDDSVIPNSKFIPSWSSKNCLAFAASSQNNRADPETIFPPESFCCISEVLLPRKHQLNNSGMCLNHTRFYF